MRQRRLPAGYGFERAGRSALPHAGQKITPYYGHVAAVSWSVATCTIRVPSMVRTTSRARTPRRSNRIIVWIHSVPFSPTLPTSQDHVVLPSC